MMLEEGLGPWETQMGDKFYVADQGRLHGGGNTESGFYTVSMS